MSFDPYIAADRFSFLPRSVLDHLDLPAAGRHLVGLWGMQPLRWTWADPGLSTGYDRWVPPLPSLAAFELWTPVRVAGAVTLTRAHSFAQFDPRSGHPTHALTASSASGIPLWTRHVQGASELTVAALEVHALVSDPDAFLAFAALNR